MVFRRTLHPACWAIRLIGFIALLAILPGCSKNASKKPEAKSTDETDSTLSEVDPNPEPAALEEVIESEPEPEPVAELKVDETSIVSFLGYHDFTQTRSPNEMLMREDKFRSQMQMLKDAGIAVVSIGDFLAWRRKEMDLPKKCVVITADDGWREVHTYMMPILKEFGYPFTVFLYTEFLDGGGRSLTQAQVEEIMASGGTIGSHSISHRDMNRMRLGRESITFGRYTRLKEALETGLKEIEAGAQRAVVEGSSRTKAQIEASLAELAGALETYDAWITKELEESKRILEEKFKVEVATFAYPYGPYNDRIVAKAMELGYDALITVNGAKANFETPLGEIPRFIIHGGDDRNWKMATSFSGSQGLDAEGDLLSPTTAEESKDAPPEVLVKVTPAEGELIANRLPLIQFDYSKLPDVEPSSLEMRVGGFGKVPATLDQENKILSWKVSRKLRNEKCSVQVSLLQAGKPRRVNWEFTIDKLALYNPSYITRFPSEVPPGEVPKAIPVSAPN